MILCWQQLNIVLWNELLELASKDAGLDQSATAATHQSHRVQKLLVLIVIRHRLALAYKALSPLLHVTTVAATRLQGRLGDGGASGAAGHGVGGAAQQQHSTWLPHLV